MAKSRRRDARWKRRLGRLCAGARRLFRTLVDAARRHCRRRRSTPIEILIVDRARRSALERDLRAGLRAIRRGLGSPLPEGTSIIVQQVVGSERPVAGCLHLGQDPDGVSFALIRLALQLDGRRLGTDEILAVLAEQCIDLMLQRSGCRSVLIPFERGTARTAPAGERRSIARPDPLSPRTQDRGEERTA